MATPDRPHKKRGLDRVDQIAAILNVVKAKRIRRIVRQLERMSPNDVTTLERLMGKR